MDHPSRALGYARVTRILDGLSPKALPELARLVVVLLMVKTNTSGRAWFTLAGLARSTGRANHRALVQAIVDASRVPGLLYFVKPNAHDPLPWRGARDTKPTVDAWGVWIPSAALGETDAVARGACAESIREHQAYTVRGRWDVEGEGLGALINPGAPIAANVTPDNDLPADASTELVSAGR